MGTALPTLPYKQGATPEIESIALMGEGNSLKQPDDLEREAERFRIERKPMVEELAAHIRTEFLAAEEFKSRFIDARLEECMRRRGGQYAPDILSQIRKYNGCETYFNVTETKCASLEAWIQDVLAPAGEDPFELRPTPVPSLSIEETQQLLNAVVARFQQEAMLYPTPEEQMAAVQQFTLQLYDEMVKLTREAANKKVGRMQELMRDQLAEADFLKTLYEFIYYLCTFPTAILKGPFLRRKKKLVWNGIRLEPQWADVQMFSAVHPCDIYPSPNARNCQEGSLCEVVTFDLRELAAMRYVPGWDVDAINQILENPDQNQTGAFLWGDTNRAERESRDRMKNMGYSKSNVVAIEYWGPVQGRVLKEWGMPGGDTLDSLEYYEIHAYLIGQYVVYTMRNPDPLDQRPYESASYEQVPGSFWGRSVPEKMADCQDAVNACLRNLIDNLALSAGPQIAIDWTAMANKTQDNAIFPMKIWYYDGEKAPGSRKPIEFYQPDSNANVLIQVAEYYEGKADDRTLIPRYTHGNADVGGAGETATGLTALMNMASKGVKRVLAYIDNYVIMPALTRLYNWNMTYGKDQEIKGDAQVRPRGVVATLVKEQIQAKRQEFLLATNNPIDQQIIGIEGRAAVLRAVATQLDLPVDKIVPTEEELRERVQASMMQQAASAATEAGMAADEAAIEEEERNAEAERRDADIASKTQ